MEDGLYMPTVFNVFVNDAAYPTARRMRPNRATIRNMVRCNHRKVPYSNSEGQRQNDIMNGRRNRRGVERLVTLLLLIHVFGLLLNEIEESLQG